MDYRAHKFRCRASCTLWNPALRPGLPACPAGMQGGVRLVTVYWHYEGPDDSPVWDTHQSNYPHLRNRLAPPTDQVIAALLSDLDERGLLATALVVCMGEFGRTPKINRHGGRDYWPAVQ